MIFFLGAWTYYLIDLVVLNEMLGPQSIKIRNLFREINTAISSKSKNVAFTKYFVKKVWEWIFRIFTWSIAMTECQVWKKKKINQNLPWEFFEISTLCFRDIIQSLLFINLINFGPTMLLSIKNFVAQCGNSKITLLLRFYVKLILVNREFQKLLFQSFWKLRLLSEFLVFLHWFVRLFHIKFAWQ